MSKDCSTGDGAEASTIGNAGDTILPPIVTDRGGAGADVDVDVDAACDAIAALKGQGVVWRSVKGDTNTNTLQSLDLCGCQMPSFIVPLSLSVAC